MARGVCHSCDMAERVLSGEFAKVPWKETPCAKCIAKHGDSAIESREQGHGRILSYDDGLGGWIGVISDGSGMIEKSKADAMELLRAFCVGIAGASDLQRHLLVLRLEGKTKAEAARMMGRSRQSIERIWGRLARRCFSRYEKDMVAE